MGNDLSDNLYRQKIRGKYHANKNLHFIFKILFLIALAALIYYLIVRFDLVNKFKEGNRKTLEEITNFKFEDIDHITTNKDEGEIDTAVFVEKFKDIVYKTNAEPEKLAENGDITYHVYKDSSRQAYELYDLGNGYIKIIQNGEIPAVYKEVENK